jgi:lauroyl/myristoyl acyltransferase
MPATSAIPDARSQRRTSARTRLLGILRVAIARVPPFIGNPLADRVGDIVRLRAVKSRRHAIDNMRHVLGPPVPRDLLKQKVRGIFRNVIRNYYDLCRAPDMTDEQIDRQVDFDEVSWQRVVEYHNQGRGVILASAHFGSFDMMTQVINRKGLPLTVMIARIKPPWASDFITSLRGNRGLDMIEVEEESEGGSALNLGGLKRLIKILREGGMVGAIVDRNMEPGGVRITFFGEEALVAAGIAKMAQRTRSVIVPGICLRLPRNRYSLVFEAPIDTTHFPAGEVGQKAILEQLFSVFERNIARHPEQWVLLQPVWRE